MDEKKSYALKETDPFNGRIIKTLREMPGGDTLALIYLKMYILQSENRLSGFLFDGADLLLLADEIGEPKETIRMLISYLFSIGELKRGKELTDFEKNVIEKQKSVIVTKEDMKKIIDEWNKIGLNQISRIPNNSTRYKMLTCRIKEYGKEAVFIAIKNISTSDFLRGKNDKGWKISFEWFVRPNNFVKVYEGKYNENGHAQPIISKFSNLPENIRSDFEKRGVIKNGNIDYSKLSSADSEILKSAGVNV